MSTEDSAPRAYRSALRERQAGETRRRIVEASARLFAEQGYQATTMASVARVAGVSTETVKAAASKAELLLAAFEVAFSGTERAEGLADSELGAGVMDVPDDVFADAVLERIVTANARGHALWTVLLGAALSDPVVDAALQSILARRSADYRLLVSELRRRGLMDTGVDPDRTAAELSFLMSPEGYQQLVVQSGWSEQAYRAWLRDGVERVFGR
ncbi:TetR/AcrR family transcriptional regulator [Microbacterium sp. CJ88]|uniref:TetR/AcrR family transcriptional regulator n=1 Tax=Microbacterium sp. CJ88 TaxID=3445672 RepID=UPI003F655A3E